MVTQRKTVMAIAAMLLATAMSGSAVARSDDDDGAVGLAKALAGLTPGKPLMCMPDYRSSAGVKAYGPDLVYTLTTGHKYVSHTAGGCEDAGRGSILITRQLQSSACRGDIATTVDQASRFPTGSCTLGDFVEYRK